MSPGANIWTANISLARASANGTSETGSETHADLRFGASPDPRALEARAGIGRKRGSGWPEDNMTLIII